jgi:flagellar hook-associated protein 1
MTIPTYTGMQTALSGLQAYMAAIDTTGENITNANTLGYTRQTVDLSESDPLAIEALSRTTGAGAQVGTGVSIDDITRVRDLYLDNQYRYESGRSANGTTLATQLSDVQAALGAASGDGSIGAALQNVWSAFNAMSSDNSPAAQTAVVSAVQTLQSELTAAQQQMTTIQSQAGAQLSSLEGQVQSDATQIASLNTEIEGQIAAGQSPNALLDQRDQLLDSLSALGNTVVTQNADGRGGVSVTFGGSGGTPGQTLVSATDAASFDPSQISASSGGQLGALASLADTSASGAITPFISGLDTIATDLVSEVNTAAGSTGLMSGTGAATLSIDPTALAGLTATQAGDVAARAGQTTDQAYATYVDNLGSAVQNAGDAATTAQSLLSAVTNQRQSVSGVSLDEEMSNLITFQQGYQASARMMNTMNSVIETLISSVGGAGA